MLLFTNTVFSRLCVFVFNASLSLWPGETPYKVDAKEISQRAKLLQRYIKDEEKELQALYALQSLMVEMEQPPSECVSV